MRLRGACRGRRIGYQGGLGRIEADDASFEFHQSDSKSSGRSTEPRRADRAGMRSRPRTRTRTERRIGPVQVGGHGDGRCFLSAIASPGGRGSQVDDSRWRWRIAGQRDDPRRSPAGNRGRIGGHTLPRSPPRPSASVSRGPRLSPGFRWGGSAGGCVSGAACERSGGGWEAAGGMSGRDERAGAKCRNGFRDLGGRATRILEFSSDLAPA